MTLCIEPDCDRPPDRARGYCTAHYLRRWRAGTLPSTPPRNNAYITECIDLYRELKAEQDVRAESECVGYETEEADYFREVEPRITYREVLERVSAEWKARQLAE